MGDLLADHVQPEAAGFDPARLARIDRHFARYVEDRRLPGWQVAVVRRGHVAHVGRYGMRDVEAGLPVELAQEPDPLGIDLANNTCDLGIAARPIA